MVEDLVQASGWRHIARVTPRRQRIVGQNAGHVERLQPIDFSLIRNLVQQAVEKELQCLLRTYAEKLAKIIHGCAPQMFVAVQRLPISIGEPDIYAS